jgi:hypothetical protein
MFQWVIKQLPRSHILEELQTYLSHIHCDHNDLLLPSSHDRAALTFRNRHIHTWKVRDPIAEYPYMPNIQHLHVLQMAKCTSMDLQQLQSRCPSLTALTLCFGGLVPNEWIECMSRMMDLRLLYPFRSLLSFCPFASFSHLERLVIDLPHDDFQEWNQIQWPPHLRHLTIRMSRPVTDTFLLDLRSLQDLQSFQLQESDPVHLDYRGIQTLVRCFVPPQLQLLSYRNDRSYYQPIETHSLQEFTWPTRYLSSLDVSGILLDVKNLLYLFGLHLSLTSLSLRLDTSTLLPSWKLLQQEWNTFATSSCSNLRDLKIDCSEIRLCFMDWMAQLPSLETLMVDHTYSEEAWWIRFLHHPHVRTHLHSFHCRMPKQFSTAFFEAVAASSIAILTLPGQRLFDQHIRVLLPDRHLIGIQVSWRYTERQNQLQWQCIQNQVHLDAWKRICFLLAWMRANQNNPIQDSGLDWVRSEYWDMPCNLLSQFMREESIDDL